MKLLFTILVTVFAHAAFAQDQVCFYKDIHYHGDAFCQKVGAQDTDLSLRAGNWGNQISSVRVLGAARVTMWVEPLFSGQSLTLDSSNPDISHTVFQDKILSYQVGQTDGRVCFYENNDYDENAGSFCMFPGNTIWDLPSIGWNDKISSIRIDGKAYAFGYENVKTGNGPGFPKGNRITILKSFPSMQIYGTGNWWNDKISAIQVLPAR